MKSLLIVLALCFSSFGISHISTTYTPTSGGVISASGNKANFDTLRNGVNRIIDTLPRFMRWASLENHDSTLTYANIDTIKGPVTIDTIVGGTTGGLYINDNVHMTLGHPFYCPQGISVGSIGASGDVDLSGHTLTAQNGTFTGTAGVDSLRSTKGIKATVGYFDSLYLKNSLWLSVDSGAVACTVWCDTATSWNWSKDYSAATGTLYYYRVGGTAVLTFKASITVINYTGTKYGFFLSAGGAPSYLASLPAGYVPMALINSVGYPYFGAMAARGASSFMLQFLNVQFGSITTAPFGIYSQSVTIKL